MAVMKTKEQLIEEKDSLRRELETFPAKMIMAQENERKIIAQDLVDEPAQYLAAIKFTLTRIKNVSPGKRPLIIGEAISQIDGFFAVLQKISEGNRPVNMNILDSILERERNHIGRELHDQTGPYLAALKLLLGKMAKSSPEIPDSLIDEACSTVEDSIKRVRAIIDELRCSYLDKADLIESLNDYLRGYCERTGKSMAVEYTGRNKKVCDVTRIVAFRIIEEALANVQWYAVVSHASIAVKFGRNILHITVKDGGKGFDHRNTTFYPSGGISYMREMVGLINGKLTVCSVPDKGTTVKAQLPMKFG